MDSVLHKRESRTMSTGVQAAILCPGQVAVHDAMEGDGSGIPHFDPASTVVLFPSADAIAMDVVRRNAVTRVVVIESKWSGCGAILDLPQLAGCTRLRLGSGSSGSSSLRSSYWRYHTKGVPEEGLSTIEAIWHFCRQWHAPEAHSGTASACHCYDDLLWYFAFFHRVIEAS
eukprot:SM000065S20216  [mRNA]  locus=s65:325214:325868:- [translate_table: standard]